MFYSIFLVSRYMQVEERRILEVQLVMSDEVHADGREIKGETNIKGLS